MNKALTFAVAMLIAGILIPLVRALAFRWNFVDHPGPRKIHLAPKPLLGGLAIYLGVVFGLLFSVGEESWSRLVALATAATFLVLVGLIDDYRSVSSQIKLALAMPLAGLILAVGGYRISAFPFSPMLVDHPTAALVLSYVLTILWVVVITTSFTILDHMDGLCAGIAAVASSFFFVFALIENQILLSLLSAAMIGATLGFLKWNFKPAKIFK